MSVWDKRTGMVDLNKVTMDTLENDDYAYTETRSVCLFNKILLLFYKKTN